VLQYLLCQVNFEAYMDYVDPIRDKKKIAQIKNLL
jgi:hypothetical protein